MLYHCALLFGGGGHLMITGADRFKFLFNTQQCCSRLFCTLSNLLTAGRALLNGRGRLLRCLLQPRNLVANFQRRLLGALGQVAYFVGNHGETAALLAGTRRFHRRVQRQQIGLEGDIVDHADDVRDLGRGALDAGHGVDGLPGDGATGLRRLHRIIGDARRLARGVGGGLDRDGLTKQGNIIGIDLVEVAPDYDHSGTTTILAAQILLNTIGRIAHNRR